MSLSNNPRESCNMRTINMFSMVPLVTMYKVTLVTSKSRSTVQMASFTVVEEKQNNGITISVQVKEFQLSPGS